MLVAKVLSAIGKVLVAAGVVVLLFAAFQLWGTGFRTSAAQAELEDEFRALQQEAAAVAAGESAAGPRPDGAPTTEAFPSATPGSPVGIIDIPKFGSTFVIVEGVDLNYLTQGPGHFPETPFPGQPGNAALAGHRTTWAAPFNRIDELVPGDTVTVETVQGRFTYEVEPQPGPDGTEVGYYIVQPDQLEILDQPPGVNRLTLMACHPKYSAAERIVVTGRLVTEPAAPSPPPAADEAIDVTSTTGLGGQQTLLEGGDPSARTPAIAWGVVVVALWLVVAVVARRFQAWRSWQWWGVYAAGAVLVAVPLFVAFEHVNKLLPAGY